MSIYIEIETEIFDNNMHTYVLQFCLQSLLVKKSKLLRVGPRVRIILPKIPWLQW